MGEFVALLRGINVGGHRKVPMADLRDLCREIGWQDIRTYIQSGNVVFRGPGKAAQHEALLESAIRRQFGFPVDVLVRSAAQIRDYVATNPFPQAAEEEPNRVLLFLSKNDPQPEKAAAALRERARDRESVEIAGGALWIHFPAGAGGTKLSPPLIDKALGAPATSRNWRTLVKLQEMLGP